MTLVPWLLTSCAFFRKLWPGKCPLSSCSSSFESLNTAMNIQRPIPFTTGKGQIVTYYWHVADNGEIVLRKPLTGSGLEEVCWNELAETPGGRFGLQPKIGQWAMLEDFWLENNLSKRITKNVIHSSLINLTLNWVKVDLTLFCLFFETSRIVNSYRAFTSVSVCREKLKYICKGSHQ